MIINRIVTNIKQLNYTGVRYVKVFYIKFQSDFKCTVIKNSKKKLIYIK